MAYDHRESKDELVDAGIKPSDLDDLIQDVKSKEATEINNAGMDAQIHFLLQRGWTVADITKLVWG